MITRISFYCLDTQVTHFGSTIHKPIQILQASVP